MNNKIKQIQSLINHIVFVVDESGSMQQLRDKVVKVFDNEVERLATRSKELNQETRVSVYTFSNSVKNLVYDKDVMRLPSLDGHYFPSGGTALIDATICSIDELKQTAQLHGDHAFLIYVLTDGQENQSHNQSDKLSKMIIGLEENWTLACFVPDQVGNMEAKRFGFPGNNISVWSTTGKGMEDVGSNIKAATESFMRGRAVGVRGTRNLFQVNTSNLSKNTVKSVLQELSPSDYSVLPVHRDGPIREFVESWMGKGTYRPGSAYYMLTKTEEIQPYKQICIQDKNNGKIYTGDEARQLLGLPKNTIKVAPGKFGSWHLFIGSSSVNRKLIAGTNCLVLK